MFAGELNELSGINLLREMELAESGIDEEEDREEEIRDSDLGTETLPDDWVMELQTTPEEEKESEKSERQEKQKSLQQPEDQDPTTRKIRRRNGGQWCQKGKVQGSGIMELFWRRHKL